MSETRTLGVKLTTDATSAETGIKKLESAVKGVDETTKKLQRTQAALAREATGIWKGQQSAAEQAREKIVILTNAWSAGLIPLERYNTAVANLKNQIKGITPPNLGGGGGAGGGMQSNIIQALNPIAGGNAAIMGGIGGKMGGMAGSAALGALAIEATGRVMNLLGEAGKKFAESMKDSDGSVASLASNAAKALPIVGTFVSGGEKLVMGFSDATSAVLKWAGYSKETYEWWKSTETTMKELEKHGEQMQKQMDALAKLRAMDKASTDRIRKLHEETALLEAVNDYDRQRLKIQQDYQYGIEEIAKLEQEAREAARQGKNVDADVFDKLTNERAALMVRARTEVRTIDAKERDDNARAAEEKRHKDFEAAKKIWDEQERRAKKLADEAQRKRDEQLRQAQSLREQSWNGSERAAMEIAKAQKVLERGDITQDTFNRIKKNSLDGLKSEVPKYQAPSLITANSVEEYRLRVADQGEKRDEEIAMEQKKLTEQLVDLAKRSLDAQEAIAAQQGGGQEVGF